MKTERVAIPVMAAIPWDTTEYCCKLEGGFISSLLGLGQILKLYRLWDGTDEEIQTMMEQVEKGLLGLMGFPCCDDAITSIQKGKGGYLVATTGGGDVTIIEDATTVADILAMPEDQALDNLDDNVCAGVRFLADRYWADVMFTLDQAGLVVAETRLAVEGLSALMNSIPLFGQTAGIVFDGWTEFLGNAVAVGIDATKLAFSDPAVRLKYSENLYCAIIDNGNILTQEIFFAAAEELPLFESQSTLLAEITKGFYIPELGTIFSTALRWYNMGALGSDPTCEPEFDCTPGWVLECDLTLSDGGLEVAPGVADGGVYVPGVGWEDTLQINSGYYHRNITLKTEFPEAQYTGAGMDFTYTQGTMALDGGAYWVLQAGDHLFGVIPNLSTPPESPWNATGSEHTGTEAAYYIPVGLTEGGGDPGGTATLTKVRLYGVGTPPEIEGWVIL